MSTSDDTSTGGASNGGSSNGGGSTGGAGNGGSSNGGSGGNAAAGGEVQTAGAFDIRNFIGTLIGLFGAILVVWGLFFFTPVEAEKTGGVNANLWAGLAMVVVAIAFVVWTKLDPIRMVVRDNEPGAEEPHDIAAVD